MDGVHKYTDMEQVIADVIPHWNWGTPEEMANWLRSKLSSLPYWQQERE